MYYLTRIEGYMYFITDSKDNVEESYSKQDILNFFRLGINIMGISVNSDITDIVSIEKYKKNNLYIYAIENNRYDIIDCFSLLNNLQLSDLSIQSNKKVLWDCPICKGSWLASPNLRFKKDRNRGCPYCSNQKVLQGFNDLATTHSYLLDK